MAPRDRKATSSSADVKFASKLSKKRAADGIGVEEQVAKKSKTTPVDHKSKTKSTKVIKSPSKSDKKSKSKTKKVLETTGDDSDTSEDDQTSALLKGFESSSEEEGNARASDDEAQGSGPLVVKDQAALEGQEQSSLADGDDTSVVYIGRIPHGFYEHQLLAYFSQFGKISKLRLARNRRTGAAKHFAFIQFEAPEVARIVADTMNNYLLFGHMLKVKVVNQGRLREMNSGTGRGIFAGCKEGSVMTRFKKVPWNRIERFKISTSDREGWTKRIEKEQSRRKDKAAKLKELGYEFEAPDLQLVADAVPMKINEAEEAALLEASPAVETKLIEFAAETPAAEVQVSEVAHEEVQPTGHVTAIGTKKTKVEKKKKRKVQS